MKKLFLSLFAVGGLLFNLNAEECCNGSAKTLKVLMIGNSFSICVLKQMPQVAADLGRKLDLCSLYIGGCPLEKHMKNVNAPDTKPYRVTWHYDSVTNQNDVPFFSVLGTGAKGDRTGNIPAMLAADRWNIVTIQQASGFSWQKDSYHPFGDQLVEVIRKLAPQAEIVVQETWSYTPWDKRLAGWHLDQNGMYDKLHEAYDEFAGKYKFRVIRMGTAVQMWRRQLPVKYAENSFGGDLCGSAKFEKNADGKWITKGDVFHLNRRGEYMQALVWTAKLFGADVTKCNYVSKEAELSADEAALMKRIAGEAAGL